MYQNKIDEARTLLTSHFEAVNNATASTQVEQFFTKLKQAGGTDDEALKLCTYEDLESFGAPKLLAKRVANIFRKGTEKPVDSSEEKAKVFKPSRVAAMTIGELVSHYDPRDISNAVAQRLKALVKEQRCVVFNTGGSVNVEATTKLVNELRDGFEERAAYPVDGVPQKVYKLGERPGQLLDENPLYPGRALRPDGDCDQTNRSWSGVSETVRQIVYLALTDTKEIRINSLMDAHNVLDLVMGADETRVRQRFQKAGLRYNELKEQGKLPSLKLSRKGGDEGNSGGNNPFGQHRTY